MVLDCHDYGIMLDSREIFLNSRTEVQEENGSMIDHWAATNFVRNLRILLSISTEPILVHMITCGGYWQYGMAIYDAIKASPAHITVVAYAHSRSMSSVIPQAADTRIIMPNAEFLIHYGTFYFSGNTTSAISEGEQLIKESNSMVDIYMERCTIGSYWKKKKMSKLSIRKHIADNMNLKQEYYMTPRESVEKGFMDAVLGDEGFETIEVLKKKKGK